jgi:hypothetical protein
MLGLEGVQKLIFFGKDNFLKNWTSIAWLPACGRQAFTLIK